MAGSYLDGGTNVPFQEAALPMLEPDKVLNEMKALQRHFKAKRDYVLDRLTGLGFKIKHIPDSTFYVWLDLSGLPEPIADGLSFFQACLEEKVIVGESHTFLILIVLPESLGDARWERNARWIIHRLSPSIFSRSSYPKKSHEVHLCLIGNHSKHPSFSR